VCAFFLYGCMHCSKWTGIYRHTVPELLFVHKFHTGTYQYILYPFILFHFPDGISLFRF
jgi:hypothetical protein